VIGWLLVTVAGFLSLVAGGWKLGIGYWVLGIGRRTIMKYKDYEL